MANKIFIYTGDGEGLPGLPREVSENEAAERGLTDVLQAAIAAKVFVEKKVVKVPKVPDAPNEPKADEATGASATQVADMADGGSKPPQPKGE
jgi:hypothetical protein